MSDPLLTVAIAGDRDIVAARQSARQVSALLGFESQDQIRIATAVSELVRNAVRYAGNGEVKFAFDSTGEQPGLEITIRDRGPGILNLDDVLSGRTSTHGGAGFGLATARRLMERFDIDSGPGRGTTIRMRKSLPRHAAVSITQRLGEVRRELSKRGANDAYVEMQEQNRELLRSLEELRLRQEDLARLNAELEDTNRGVLALYAELDERATHLRVADETKSRFLSTVSHEFRTPVNSIMALSQILLHRLDGELTPEQEKQVGYIRQAASQLSTLIDDLLDLRKVESGKIQVRVEPFSVVDLFGALRGMFKPLALNEQVELTVEDPDEPLLLRTDQGKVAQILRNLISNALKFTPRGTVTLSAEHTNGDRVVFTVRDTGIGIAPENHRRIFEEFTQVENPLQSVVKGTGLGLPLSQKLAGLLGGAIEVVSAVGQGSTFSLVIPMVVAETEMTVTEERAAGDTRRKTLERVLIVDDNEIERYALRQFLPAGTYEVIEASGGYEGLRLARQRDPDLIFLDIVMPDIEGPEVLKLLKATDQTRSIPVVIFSSQQPEDYDRSKLTGAIAFLLKKDLSRESVAAVIRQVREAVEVRHESIA
jgi:signal transduction histidine kinase/ActR/RegA family two-component response regulator